MFSAAISELIFQWSILMIMMAMMIMKILTYLYYDLMKNNNIEDFPDGPKYLSFQSADDDDDEIAYFTVRWKTRKLVLSTAPAAAWQWLILFTKIYGTESYLYYCCVLQTV